MRNQGEQLTNRGKESKTFPDRGYTLAVHGVGSMGTTLAEHFLTALGNSMGRDELLGVVSLSDVHRNAKVPVENTMGPLGWRLLHKPSVIVDDIEGTVQAVQKASEKHGDSARVMLHFVSFEHDNTETVGETVKQLKEKLPSLLHIGVLVVPSDPIRKTYFQKGIEKTPLASFPIPLILVDQAKCQEQDRKNLSDTLPTEDALLYGLAGLVSARRVFPHLNPHTYQELLEALTEKSPLLGVGIDVRTTPVLTRWGVFKAMSLQALQRDAERTIADCLSLENRVAPLDAIDGGLHVVIGQLPLHPEHPSWKDRDFIEDIEADKESIVSPLVPVYGFSRMPGTDNSNSIVAVDLFPGVLK